MWKEQWLFPKIWGICVLIRITSRSRAWQSAEKDSLASLTPERDYIDLWFGVFTSAQPPTMQRACAHMQHVPAASPIIGPGYEARLMSDPREPTYILVCLANYKKIQ